MVEDSVLPIFPFRINWREGLAERLEWKTDILPDFLGNEQRRALRLTPRRDFEATFTLWDQDRQFWDLWLHRMGDTDFLFPLWHDGVRTTQDAAQGENTIWVDPRGLEFKIGSYGLLRGNTALSFERVLIAEVHDDRIVTAQPLVNAWPKRTRFEPLVRGRTTEQTDSSARNSRVSEAQAVIQCVADQPYSEGVAGPLFEEIETLTTGPNRTEDLPLSYLWAFSESDSLTGRRYRLSDSGRAITQQKHVWLLHGRTAKQAFRQMLYRFRGAQTPFWLPTFSEDMTLSRDVAAGQMSIYLRAFGYGYTGGVSSGRDRICIFLRDGTQIFRRVTGMAVSGNLAEERLAVTPALPAIEREDVAMISWMVTSRFENDKVEMKHRSAADGVTDVSMVTRAFRNERTPPDILSAPIPAA